MASFPAHLLHSDSPVSQGEQAPPCDLIMGESRKRDESVKPISAELTTKNKEQLCMTQRLVFSMQLCK